MKLEKNYNTYLADLSVMVFKLHNLHWNAMGQTFVQLHLFTEDIYNALFDYLDDIAEHLRKNEIVPVSKLADYLQMAGIKEVDARLYKTSEIIDIVLEDLLYLRAEATKLRNAADEEGDFSGVAMLEEQIARYNKDIWFLRATKG